MSGDIGIEQETKRLSRFGPMFWTQTVLGLAIAGFGVYFLAQRSWTSVTGFLILCVGVMIVPIGMARLLGGLGAVAVAVWLILNAAGMFDYIYGALVVFIGGSTAWEGFRSLRNPGSRRRVGNPE